MHKNNDRAPRISSILSAISVTVMALAACSSSSSSHPPVSPSPKVSPSAAVVTTPSPSVTVTDTQSAAPSAAGRFTSPREGGKVAYQQLVRGVITGIPSGHEAWILVYPSLAPAYWPEIGPLAPDPTGAFRTSVYFGASATQNSGEQFTVLIVTASPTASQQFRDFVARYPQPQGFLSLPLGVRILAQVTVTRL